jgi:hypothetical protein
MSASERSVSRDREVLVRHQPSFERPHVPMYVSSIHRRHVLNQTLPQVGQFRPREGSASTSSESQSLRPSHPRKCLVRCGRCRPGSRRQGPRRCGSRSLCHEPHDGSPIRALAHQGRRASALAISADWYCARYSRAPGWRQTRSLPGTADPVSNSARAE